jgi:hypothetical protein
MKLRFYIIVLCLLCAACTKVQSDATNFADTVGNETKASYDKARDLLDINRPKPPVKRGDIQPRYCYRTMNDVVCYAAPQPGQEYRLLAYQDRQGHTGYTLSYEDEHIGTPYLSPLKSVQVGPPPPVLGIAEAPKLKEITFDPSELEPKELVPERPQ